MKVVTKHEKGRLAGDYADQLLRVFEACMFLSNIHTRINQCFFINKH